MNILLDDPQLIFIHIHQLLRIQYTSFRLDAANIYWWWRINLCRVDDIGPCGAYIIITYKYTHINTYVYIYIYIYVYDNITNMFIFICVYIHIL